jgi:chitin disaccharide deacetylase
MRRLIINADDLGINPQRSHGIFECMEFGVVRSASIIPNCADSHDAAKKARERKFSCGLHLNLNYEYPLSKKSDVPTLTDANGQFYDVDRLETLINENAIDSKDVEREIRAQIEWIFDSYGTPTHIDSQDHIHIHPFIANILIPIINRYGIRFTRIPCERPLPPFGYETSQELLAYAQTLGERALEGKKMYESHDITTTDHFRGTTLEGNASLKNFRHILAKLPEGITELMVHPSSAITYGTPFDLDPQRQTELRMLLDPSIPEMLAERKIELSSWADL